MTDDFSFRPSNFSRLKVSDFENGLADGVFDGYYFWPPEGGRPSIGTHPALTQKLLKLQRAVRTAVSLERSPGLGKFANDASPPRRRALASG